MLYQYGEFPDEQVNDYKTYLRKYIYFLLLCVDFNTAHFYKNIDVNKSFDTLLYKLDGLNELLFYPEEIIDVMSMLKEAQVTYNLPVFGKKEYKKYRRLVLDSGAKILELNDLGNDLKEGAKNDLL